MVEDLANSRPDVGASKTAADRYCCSLVIPTKNGGELFRRAVERLCAQTCWPRVEFIVVDSGSTDDTPAVARSAGAVVHSIAADAFNHGATRDYGISLASCNAVILMVQDAIALDAHLIERLLAALSGDRVAGAFARQIPQPTADAITKRNVNSALTAGLARKVKAIEHPGQYRKLSPVAKYHLCNFDNVCSAIDKRVWEQERFGEISFGEDIDWAQRVLKHGFKIVYEPAAAVIHSHERSLGYDYRRTYVSHRLLYRLFGVQFVPTPRQVLRTWASMSLADIALVSRAEKHLPRKIRMLVKAPAANLLCAYAQYRAARDESRNVRMKAGGI